MNILILSSGRRVDIINYFKLFFHRYNSKVYTADMSPYSAALYEGDKSFLINKDFENLDKYVDDVIDVCKSNSISAVLTLIDPELVLLADNKEKFLNNGIIPIVSSKEFIDITFDKFVFYEKFREKLPLLPTYSNVYEVYKALEKDEINFPLFAKIRNGSGSAGIGKIDTKEGLKIYEAKENYIFQPCLLKSEYGCDVYFDIKSKKIVTYFIKKKLNMRSGETDKSISVKNKKIEELLFKLDNLGFSGPVDVDIFECVDGNFYINEINPRFGGGYPHAYNAGVNFIELIFNNLSGLVNNFIVPNYVEDYVMIKYNGMKFLNKSDLLHN